MHWKIALSALLAALFLGGCATSTPYRAAPEAEDYGYRDMSLTSDRYRVSFAGNSNTSRETVETYVLYRAAEVALDAGHDYFRLVSRDTEALTDYSGFNTGLGVGGFWGDPFFGTSVGVTNARADNRYRSVAEILVGPDIGPAEGRIDVYDARELKSKLEGRIKRPSEDD